MPPKLPTADVDLLSGGLPIAQSQPDFLAAIGKIRGMNPREVDQAGVLEIGCGDGSNLLPLAERYPRGTFLGWDESPRHIAAAEEEAHALGLSNVTFRHQKTIQEFDAGTATFDYILAPGIYSRFDARSRDKLLAMCQRHLAPEGIAYVDYNAYPGWHLHEMLRSMMRYHAGKARTATKRLAAGRALLEFLLASLPADGDGALLSETAKSILQQPDSLVFRNYLHNDCHAFAFAQFIEHAERHALQIVGDCTVGVAVSNFFTPGLERELAAITSDEVEKEHFRDVVHNASHRQTLLCHDSIELVRLPAPERMRGIYLDARLHLEDSQPPLDSPANCTFTVPSGLTVSSHVPEVKRALHHLGTLWPNYIEYEELVQMAVDRSESQANGPTIESTPSEPRGARRLRLNLAQGCCGGIIQVHGAAQAFVTAISDRPTASPLARRQAARGETATSRKHLSVRLAAFDRHVLELLDGTRSVQDIVDHLAAAAESRRIGLVEEGQPVPPERAIEFIGEQLQSSLARLAENALLIA